MKTFNLASPRRFAKSMMIPLIETHIGRFGYAEETARKSGNKALRVIASNRSQS